MFFPTGLFSAGLTTYVVQEPTETTRTPNTTEQSAAESIQNDNHITPQIDGSINEHIKETEL